MDTIPYLKFASLHTGAPKGKQVAPPEGSVLAKRVRSLAHVRWNSSIHTLSTIFISTIMNTKEEEPLRKAANRGGMGGEILDQLHELFVFLTKSKCPALEKRQAESLFRFCGSRLFGPEAASRKAYDDDLTLPSKIGFDLAKETTSILLKSTLDARRTDPGEEVFLALKNRSETDGTAAGTSTDIVLIKAFINEVATRAWKYLDDGISATVSVPHPPFKQFLPTLSFSENCQLLVGSKIGYALDQGEQQALSTAMETVVGALSMNENLLVALLDKEIIRALYLLMKSLDSENGEGGTADAVGRIVEKFMDYSLMDTIESWTNAVSRPFLSQRF